MPEKVEQMAALESPPARGQEVQIFSRSSGGWINATVSAVDGEVTSLSLSPLIPPAFANESSGGGGSVEQEATVVYVVDGQETSKVVDWDDPEQLTLVGTGGGPAPVERPTWAASSGQVFDPDDDYVEEIANPLGPAPPGNEDAKGTGIANGVGPANYSAAKAVGAPAPSPEALLQRKPADSADTNALLMWMKDMIENQHKDIAELRETVATSVAAGGGSALSLIAAGGLAAAEVARVDAPPVSRDGLIEFMHKNPVFAGAVGLNPVEKNGFIEHIAGRLERRFYYKDSMVIRKGSDANEMYFLYKGVAEVFLDHPDTAADLNIPPVAKLKSGLFFGEAALLAETPEPRNAWIRAQCDMEVYVLTAEELRQALSEHPAMATLFNNEKHRRAQQREEHLERFANGGGNFKKGFKVRLRTLGSREKLAAQVAQELQEAFETVPEVFPRSAVEALLLDKMETLESIRDQLAATGTTEQDHGHGGVLKPPTPKEKKKIQAQMGFLALFFFVLTFLPFVSEQHHAGKHLPLALGWRARRSLAVPEC